MRWPWQRAKQQPKNLISISDPQFASLFAVTPPNFSGTEVTETTALGLSAVYRAVNLIAGTIAGLPLRSYVPDADEQAQRYRSVMDNPGGADGPTPYEWTETVLAHLLLHGNAYLRHVYNGAGALYALQPLHPLYVYIELPSAANPWPVGGRWFVYTDPVSGAQYRYDARSLTHIPALVTDPVYGYGLSPIGVARNSLGTAVAGDRAAAKVFSTGALFGGLITPDEELEPDEATELKDEILKATSGWENAAGLVVTNRRLNVSPWTMTMQDAQFLQSRQFSIEEIARWFGVPPHLLMQTEKQTSWGTGVAEQNRGLGRYTLAPWTARVEQRLSRLLPATRWCEFDYTALERPNIETETGLVLQLVQGGLLSPEDGARRLGLPPLNNDREGAQDANTL